MSEENKANPILEQLNQSLSETLAFIKDTGGTAIDFAKEQTPLYIKELLLYDFIDSLTCFILGVIFIGIGLISIYNLYKLAQNDWSVPGLRRTYGKDIIINNPTKEDWQKAKEEVEEGKKRYVLVCAESRTFINSIICFLSMTAGFIISIENLTWVKIKVAPRVYVVEKIKEIVK